MLYALGPDGLVDYQKKAYGTDNEHVIPETIHYWMVENGGRHNTLRTYETTIRSFFLHNRVELRKDRNLRLKPTRFSKVTMFSIEEVKAIYARACHEKQ
jgi:hypothetical protein